MLSNTIEDSSMRLSQRATDVPPVAIVIDFSDIIYNYSPFTTSRPYLFERVTPLSNLMLNFGVKDIIEAVFILDYDNPECRHVVWEMLEHKFRDFHMDFWTHTESIETLNIIVDLVTEEVDTRIRNALSAYDLPTEHANYLFHQWVGAGSAILIHRYAEKNLY